MNYDIQKMNAFNKGKEFIDKIVQLPESLQKEIITELVLYLFDEINKFTINYNIK